MGFRWFLVVLWGLENGKKSICHMRQWRSESESVWVKAAKPKGGGKSKGKGPRELGS